MRILVTAAAVFGLALSSPAFADEERDGARYEPRDECRSVAGAAAFLDALATAVAARDTDALVALAAEDVRLDFGGGEGRDEFRIRLGGGEAYHGDLWKELAAVLTLGCASEGHGLITLPWFFAQDFGELDPFDTMLTIKPEVAVREAPSDDARVISTLEWEPVELAEAHDPQADYVEVILPDHTHGFVEPAALRSLIDYRLIAESTEKGWRISAFVAGD